MSLLDFFLPSTVCGCLHLLNNAGGHCRLHRCQSRRRHGGREKKGESKNGFFDNKRGCWKQTMYIVFEIDCKHNKLCNYSGIVDPLSCIVNYIMWLLKVCGLWKHCFCLYTSITLSVFFVFVVWVLFVILIQSSVWMLFQIENAQTLSTWSCGWVFLASACINTCRCHAGTNLLGKSVITSTYQYPRK